MTDSNIYLARGVSSSKKEVHQAIDNIDPGIFPGAFCKVLSDTLTNDPDYCLLMHADGAGTKSSLAYVYWKETGDISVFKGIATDSLVMNLDDLVCVGAIENFVLSNTIGRNKFKIPGEVIKAIIDGYEEAIESLGKFGIQIDMCGGETADVGDLVRTLIVDSTITTRIRKQDIINLDNIEDGDIIIGFASDGKASWDSKYNSGIGSNGLTAARHDCFNAEYIKKYPESFSADIPLEMTYCGNGKIDTPLKGTELTLGQAVLSPTRSYAPLIKELILALGDNIHGIIHCTGGGQTKCLNFGRNMHYIKNNLFPLPPIFKYIQESGNYPLRDLYPVYNMGHRLELFCKEKYADEIIKNAAKMGIAAQIVGYCKTNDQTGNRLTIEHNEEIIDY